MISKETFDAELSLCHKMSKEKSGCAWGKCFDCGVPLLLQKLHKGEIIEEKEAVRAFKAKVLK